MKQITDRLNELENYNIKLKKQLSIATNALNKMCNPTIGDIYNQVTDEIDYSIMTDIAQKALKEIEEVK